MIRKNLAAAKGLKLGATQVEGGVGHSCRSAEGHEVHLNQMNLTQHLRVSTQLVSCWGAVSCTCNDSGSWRPTGLLVALKILKLAVVFKDGL